MERTLILSGEYSTQLRSNNYSTLSLKYLQSQIQVVELFAGIFALIGVRQDLAVEQMSGVSEILSDVGHA